VRRIAHIVIFAVIAVLAGCSTLGPPAQGIEVRFIIYSVSIGADGTRNTQTYENAVLAASGERFEREIGRRYRISLTSQIQGGSALVEFAAFDILRQVQAGAASAVVPLGGQAEASLSATNSHQYRVILKAAKRDLPKPAV